MLDLHPTSAGIHGVESTDLRTSDVDRTLDPRHLDSLVFPELAVDRLSSVHLIQIFRTRVGVTANDSFGDQVEVAYGKLATSAELLVVDVVDTFLKCDWGASSILSSIAPTARSLHYPLPTMFLLY
jgi:hypothetical protein